MWCSHLSLPILLSLIVLCFGQDILEYSEGNSSRTETGQPGDSVTGSYSWVDAEGLRHDVWYEADEMGFRAFGDVLPGSAASVGDGTGPRDVMKLLGRPVIIFGTSAVNNSPQETTNMRNSKKVEEGVSKLGGDVQLTSAHSSHGILSDGPIFQPEKSHSLTGIKNIPSENSKNLINMAVTNINIDLVNKSLHSTLNNLSKDKIHTFDRSVLGLLSLGSKSEKTSKNINNIKVKDISKFNIMQNDQPSVLNETTNAEQLIFPQLVTGSRFVLVAHKIIPTKPKLRIGSVPLMPQAVPTTGKETPVIMGLHSSGSKGGLAKNLMPIALMLKQTFSHIHPPSINNQKETKTSNNGPTPRPRKVTGKLNLDNFFRPAVNHQTTPKPFQLPVPSKELDYQYPEDYYYYDYVDTPRSPGGPLAKDNQEVSQPKSNQRRNTSHKSEEERRNTSNISEEDQDFSESYEDND